jgi:hypothetical protein
MIVFLFLRSFLSSTLTIYAPVSFLFSYLYVRIFRQRELAASYANHCSQLHGTNKYVCTSSYMEQVNQVLQPIRMKGLTPRDKRVSHDPQRPRSRCHDNIQQANSRDHHHHMTTIIIKTTGNIKSISTMSSMFPYKLHEMLEYAEKRGMESIVSWLPDGRAFKVHQPEPFMKTLVPSYFKQNRYKSFQRQLHLYGFERITEGKNKGK